MTFNPAVFGEGFHVFVQSEYAVFGFLSPIFHVLSLILLVLTAVFGNRIRRLFTVYFTVGWMFLFGYWGIYGILYWLEIGWVYLAVYCAAPVLLCLITCQWIHEVFRPSLDLDLRFGWRLAAVLPILIWGFWYPSYIYGTGFVFNPKDLLFSYYGLMPCPTTMVVLSLISVNYPRGNRRLYHLMSAYALFIGGATVASGWLPDIPFVVLGLYTFILGLLYRFGKKV